jgi:hypothetical protein
VTNSSAKVLSVQAIKDFRVSLVNFIEEARAALSSMDMELRRTRNWLERDQLSYWQMQVKRRHEEWMRARTELHRRQISQMGSDVVSDTEQKEALRDAQRRLRLAEEKVEIVKRLIPQFQQAVSDYLSHAQPLGDHLSGGIEKSLFTLDRVVQSLEAYLAVAPPSAPREESLSSVGSSNLPPVGRGGVETSKGRPDDGTRADPKPEPESNPDQEQPVVHRVNPVSTDVHELEVERSE